MKVLDELIKYIISFINNLPIKFYIQIYKKIKQNIKVCICNISNNLIKNKVSNNLIKNKIPNYLIKNIINFIDNTTIKFFTQTCKKFLQYNKKYYEYLININTKTNNEILSSKQIYNNNKITEYKKVNLIFLNGVIDTVDIFTKLVTLKLNYVKLSCNLNILTNLKSLTLINCHDVNIDNLINLEHLQIKNCYGLTKFNLSNTLIKKLEINFDEIVFPVILDYLKISNCNALKNLNMKLYITEIKQLHIFGCSCLDIIIFSQNVENVKLTYTRNILKMNNQEFSNVKSLTYNYQQHITLKSTILDFKFEHLKCLNLKNIFHTTYIFGLENILHFTLQNCPQIIKKISEILHECINLKTLNLSNNNDLKHLCIYGYCKQLEQINLSNCEHLEYINLSCCKHLKFINLSMCTNIEMINLSHCEQIKFIDTYNCNKIQILKLQTLEQRNLLNQTNDIQIKGIIYE